MLPERGPGPERVWVVLLLLLPDIFHSLLKHRMTIESAQVIGVQLNDEHSLFKQTCKQYPNEEKKLYQHLRSHPRLLTSHLHMNNHSSNFYYHRSLLPLHVHYVNRTIQSVLCWCLTCPFNLVFLKFIYIIVCGYN